MKCGCHDLAGEAASARSHRDRVEALHPPRTSAMQSPLLRPRHGASGVWTPSCISSAHSRSSSAHALSPLEILSRKLRRMRNTCVRHFPELAAWHCSTVMNMAYRHIEARLHYCHDAESSSPLRPQFLVVSKLANVHANAHCGSTSARAKLQKCR